MDCCWNVAANTSEYELLAHALECSKNILNRVNHAVKECENHQRLVDIQRRLDRRPIENLPNAATAEFKVGTTQLYSSLSDSLIYHALNQKQRGKKEPKTKTYIAQKK